MVWWQGAFLEGNPTLPQQAAYEDTKTIIIKKVRVQAWNVLVADIQFLNSITWDFRAKIHNFSIILSWSEFGPMIEHLNSVREK